MARFCNNCNKKMGFFEEQFEGNCRECHNKKIEEELEKNRIEMQKRIEEQKALEEKRKEEEKRRYLKLNSNFLRIFQIVY